MTLPCEKHGYDASQSVCLVCTHETLVANADRIASLEAEIKRLENELADALQAVGEVPRTR